MSGIWERVAPNGDENQIRVNVSLLETELTGVSLGVRARADAKNAIESNMEDTLTAAELVDLNAMADIFETGSTLDRLVYAHKVKYALNSAEVNQIDEATFRTVLGI